MISTIACCGPMKIVSNESLFPIKFVSLKRKGFDFELAVTFCLFWKGSNLATTFNVINHIQPTGSSSQYTVVVVFFFSL